VSIRTRRIVYIGTVLDRSVALWSSSRIAHPGAFRDLESALQRLEPLAREIIRRRFWQGQSLAHIARVLGISPGHVRRELQNALTRLSGMLPERGGPVQPSCRLCSHPLRYRIDRLLSGRREGETWRGFLTQLRREYGISGLPATALECHLRTHP